MSEDQMDRGCLEPDVVEEIYEEGSAMLARRSAFLFLCAGYILYFVIKGCVVGACIGQHSFFFVLDTFYTL